MTKNELVSSVAGSCDLTKAKAQEVVECVFSSLQESLVEGDRFSYQGFGTFSVTTRAAREGRNPKTGETIQIPESRNVKFKVAPSMKEMLNG